MTRPKVIVITLLAVLVALGSASLLAQNGSSATTAPTFQLTPNSGCPGTTITVFATFPSTDQIRAPGSVTADGKSSILTSYPDGLISQELLIFSINGDLEVSGTFIVGDSVCAGDYLVTIKPGRTVEQGVGNGQTLEASTHFTVGGQRCPGLAPCRPVGGVVMPTNTLAITAPYLVLAGLIVAVSAVVAVKKRRD